MIKAEKPTSETQQQLLCGSCGSDELPLKKCMGCGAVAYCGTTCQKAHWVLHRPDCTRIKKEKKERENPSAKAKEAARGSVSGLGGMGSLMTSQSQRYNEADIYNVCLSGKHDELDKAFFLSEL